MYPPHLPEKLSDVSLKRRKAKAETRSRQFIPGPVYLDPLISASKLRGKSLCFWLLILYRLGVERTAEVEIRPGMLARFGIGRRSGYRALNALETAGLVSVERHRGRSPVVSIKQRGGNASG